MKRFIAVLLVLAAYMVSSSSVAVANNQIDTASQWNGTSAIGVGGAQLYGQTFLATGDKTVLDNFRVYLATDGILLSVFGSVMEWAGSKAVGPVLYQSTLQSANVSGPLVPLTFSTGGLGLTAGHEYVLFVGSTDALFGSHAITGIVSDNKYPDGQFVVATQGQNLTSDDWYIATGSFPYADIDLAFVASFAVPEPTTVVMLVMGTLAMLTRRRR